MEARGRRSSGVSGIAGTRLDLAAALRRRHGVVAPAIPDDPVEVPVGVPVAVAGNRRDELECHFGFAR